MRWMTFAVTTAVSLACLLGLQPAAGERAVGFSQLPAERRAAILKRVEAPPTAQRDAPYSTPMYYLLAKGFQDGPNNELKLDRNRPDWQEVLIKDWVDLGLTSTLYMTGPTEWDDPAQVQAILDYCKLSQKYGLKVGVRLAGDGKFQGIDAGGWDIHPNNPKSRIKEYVEWTGRVAKTLKGQVEFYVLGDELNSRHWEESTSDGKSKPMEAPEDRRWTPQVYMQVFRPVAESIKAADPRARVSMFGMNGLDWKYVEGLLKEGYAEIGDAVAANPDDHKYPFETIREFAAKVRKARADFKLYSNGVGYVASQTKATYPDNVKSWPRLDDDAQANRVAQMMVSMFDVAWDCTPYYIIVRQWTLPDGRAAPHWYGFFGFTDLVIGKDDKLTVKRYPAWYALQSIAHVLHSRSKTTDAPFKLQLSEPVDHALCYVRNDYECLVVLWNASQEKRSQTTVRIPTARFRYPARVSMQDYRRLDDVPARVDGDSVVLENVDVGAMPCIIRLVAEP